MILRFFWFFLPLVIFVQLAVQIRPRLLSMAEAGEIEKEEIGRVVAWVGGLVTTFSVLLGFIQLAGGWATPLCVYTLDWSRWAVTASWVVSWLADLLTVGWLLFGEGAVAVARYGPAFGINARPSAIKWGGAIALLALAVGSTVAASGGAHRTQWIKFC
jgi:hypothetical protein